MLADQILSADLGLDTIYSMNVPSSFFSRPKQQKIRKRLTIQTPLFPYPQPPLYNVFLCQLYSCIIRFFLQSQTTPSYLCTLNYSFSPL
jgi:hypothetical protein